MIKKIERKEAGFGSSRFYYCRLLILYYLGSDCLH